MIEAGFIDQVPLSFYLLLSAVLFSIGAGGVLVRRNVIIILMCVEIMMNAVKSDLHRLLAVSRFGDGADFCLYDYGCGCG